MSEIFSKLQDRIIRLTENLTETTDRVLVCQNVSPANLLRLATDQKMTQIVQEGSPQMEQEVMASVSMIDSPNSYFEFPLASILTPEQVNQQMESQLRQVDVQFHRSDSKSSVLEEIERYLVTLTRPRSLLEDVKLVADELFTNALYNAPFAGTSVIMSREQEVVLKPEQSGRIMLGVKDDRLVLACEDLFGKLNVMSLLTRIRRCYEEGAHKMMNFDRGGAGIGTYMVFHCCTSLYVGVRQNQKTLIACVFPIGKGVRARESLDKNIHYIDY